MNRGELVAAVTEATSLPRAQVDSTLSAVLEQIVGATAAGEKVTLPGFGTFEARERAAREGRNPATGQVLQIGATRSVGFKVGTAYKRQVAASTPEAKKSGRAAKAAPAAVKRAAPAAKKAAKPASKKPPGKK
ncbi:MAG: HU family DNA-binding protein [Candidatus Dormibacteraeota bacterium]|nr:HU family DNA-binding protein [Candidatus Dormibacteraeota bacterium]